MTRILGKLFIFSFLFWFISVFCTRWSNFGPDDDIPFKTLYSLPWDTLGMEGTKDLQIQLGVLSQNQVAELLKNNPDNFEGCYLTNSLNPADFQTPNKDYLIIRYKNKDRTAWGDIKCYASCFQHSIVEHIYAPSRMTEYSNIIIPYPAQEDSKKSCAVSVKWKNIWGSP
jgi:hypothetical protein